MKFKVGDSVTINVKIRKVYPDAERYLGEIGDDAFFIYECDLLVARALSKEERKKEIEEQIQGLLNEMESLK